jgi:hypothetical protein
MLVLGLVVVLIAACDAPPQRDSSAYNMLPNLADYNMADAVDIQDAISKVAGAAALGAAQPQITALVAAANEIAKCYQQAGAIVARVYTNKADVFKAGTVVIINRNALTNPQTFLNCVAPSFVAAPAAAFSPCANAYTLPKGNNEFYIGYVATNTDVCAAFCANLDGCGR